MMELLRDPAWQFVGVVLTLLTLGVAFWIYWLQRQTKEFAFGLVSSARPLSIADELTSKVTVHLNGRPVGNLHLLTYVFKNSGHRAIIPEDYQSPLALSFPCGEVVSAEVSSKYPRNLDARLTVAPSRVEIAPLLMNAGDQLVITVLLSEKLPTWVLDLRIVDIADAVEINTTPPLPPFWASGLPPLMGISIATGAGISFLFEDRSLSYVFFFVAALVPVFAIVTRMWRGYGLFARRRIRAIEPL